MAYVTNLDLARQAKLLPGDEAFLNGSITLDENLTTNGQVKFLGITPAPSELVNAIFLDSNNRLWSQPVTGGTGGSGSVTSVDMSVPSGFAVSGNPITSIGTLALTFSDGYSLPTNANQNNWNTAYSWGNPAGVYEPIISAGSSTQYWRGDKTWQSLQTAVNTYAPTLGGVGATGTWNITSANSNELNGVTANYTAGTGIDAPIVMLNGVLRYGTAALLQSYLNINNGSTLTNNISGNAATATSSVSWGPTLVSDFNTPIGFNLLQATSGSTINSPLSAGWGQGIQFSTNNDSRYVNQLVFDVNGLLYIRSKVVSNWGNWDRLLTNSETSSASTTSATIVRRNGSGQIFSTYFNTTSVVESSVGAVNKIYGGYNSDGYIRAFDAPSVQRFININDGSTLSNGISGNAATASNSTLWNTYSLDISTTYSTGFDFLIGRTTNTAQGRLISSAGIQAYVGLNNGSTLTNNINGSAASATSWGGTTYNGNPATATPAWILGYDATNAVWKPTSAALVNAYIGLNNGSTLTNNINGNSATSTAASYVVSPDGSRVASSFYPNANPNRVRFDFANASTLGTGGNYGGVMTYSPWTGTAASTGDASYQLAFGSSAVNATGTPMFRIRNGIDTAWNGWYDVWTTANLVGPSVTAVASTLVQRDGNAYINGTYINMSDGVSSTAPTYMIGKTTDNYYRSFGSAAINSFLGINNGSTLTNNVTGSAASATTWNGRIWGGASGGSDIYFMTSPDAGTWYYSTVTQTRAELGLGTSALYNAASTVNASTVVLRDANGYIFTNYLNSTDAIDSGTTPTYLMGKNGSDSYLRSYNSTNIKNMIGLGNYLPLAGGTLTGALVGTSATFSTVSGGRGIFGYDNGSAGTVGASNWFRSAGATGWFNDTYASGIYMTDTTYVRIYGGAGLYSAGNIVSLSTIIAGSAANDNPYVGGAFQVNDNTNASLVAKSIRMQMGANGDMLLSTFTGPGDSTGTWTAALRIYNANRTAAFISTVSATAFNVTSARDKKENISLYEDDALSKINNIKISSFNYKNDEDKHFRVGFIADDTDELFSTKDKNSMDIATTLGVALKAIQELSEKIKNLELQLSKQN